VGAIFTAIFIDQLLAERLRGWCAGRQLEEFPNLSLFLRTDLVSQYADIVAE
jgi:hypothetical protein